MGIGSAAGGFVQGWQAADRSLETQEDVALKRQQRERETQRNADEKALRDSLRDGNASASNSSSARSSQIDVIQRVGTNLTSDPAFARSMAENESFATGEDVNPTAAFRVAGRGIYNEVADATDAQAGAAADAGMGHSPGKRNGAGLDDYLKRVAPRVVQTLVQQGKLEQVKHFSDFVRTEQGQAYTETWAGAMRATAAGDFTGALPQIERLYNAGVPDGRSAKITALDGDRYRVDVVDDATGQVVSSKEDAAGNLARLGVTALAPEKMATWFATRQADLEKETIQNRRLDRQAELQGARETEREDRRDERLGMRLDAQGQQLERRLAAQGKRGLTATQERANAEIDAAREAVAGLSPQDIMRRTAKATNTGRENPDYDPGLARQAALANRRKVGDDEMFDQPKPKPAIPAFDRADVAKRFRADKTMNNRTLGKETPNGIEVMEKGKLIGYFQ